MSRPPGPPPYTAEEIELLDTPEKRFIALAELNSYIAGHRLADLRDQGLLGAPAYTLRNNNDAIASSRRGSTLSDTFPDIDSNEDQSSPGGNAVGSQRGLPRNHRSGTRFSGYQPYPPPRHARSNYVDRSPAWGEAIPRNNQTTKSNALCPNFTSTGNCTRFGCPDLHDVNKLALCKRFLYKKTCTEASLCSLSHQATPNNIPHCLYYLENRCTNSPCMFLHVHMDRNAPVCDSFGKLGYCVEGEACSHLHVYECPDFANNGLCAAGDQCPLRHAHHASRMKAAARGSSGTDSPESFVGTDEYGDLREATSSPSETQNHAITQQHDYVAFDPEN